MSTEDKIINDLKVLDNINLFKDDHEKQKLVDRMKTTGGLTNVLKDMAEHSEVDPNSPHALERLKGKYDIEGRLQEADVPSGYSFDEMNRPLGVSGSGGPTIDIQDILQQRNILQMDIEKMNKSQNIFGSDYQGTKTEDLNKVLNSMYKLSHMIDMAMDWSEEDTAREKNIMIEQVLDLYKRFPGEFPKYKIIEELKQILHGKSK